MKLHVETVAIDVEVLGRHWRGIRNAGAVLIALGAVAILLPMAAALALELLLGWVLLVGGVALGIQAFRTSLQTQFWWQLGIGVLNGLVGLLLLLNPMQGILTLTVVLAVLFLLEGVLKLALVLPLRTVRGWGWLLASGVLPLLMGVVILAGLPTTAAWALGLLVGINLLVTGFVLLSVSRAVNPDNRTTA
jgi:uncharacterized membrane protein HdeD (DUF308 family)